MLPQLACAPSPHIYKWVQRFLQQGLEGLQDKPRSGHPPDLSDQNDVDMVLSLGYLNTNWLSTNARRRSRSWARGGRYEDIFECRTSEEDLREAKGEKMSPKWTHYIPKEQAR